MMAAVSCLQGSTINLTYVGGVNNNSVTRTITNGPTYGLPGGATNVGVTLMRFTSGGIDYYAYCVEAQQGAGSGTFTYDPTFSLVPGNIKPTNLTSQKIEDLYWLFGQVSNPFSPTLNETTMAAMQMSIWEITRETAANYDVLSGNVFFTGSNSAYLTAAQNLLNNVTNRVGAPNRRIVALYSADRQDLIVSMPEPGSWAMMGSALLLVGWKMRRRGV